MNKDYYKILGISENATDSEISSAFKKLAMKYHPDRNKGDKSAEEKFKEINEAYNTLKDSKSRQEYDMMRKFGGTGGFGSSGFHHFSSGGFDPFADSFMKDFFNSYGFSFDGFSSFRRPVNRDEYVNVEINLSDLLSTPANENYVIEAGKNKTKVTIPKNVVSGNRFRIKGAAYNNSNHDAGDLYITVVVKIDKPNYSKINDRLILNLNVDIMKTLNEPLEVVIPAKESIDGKELKFSIDNTKKGNIATEIELSGRGFYYNSAYRKPLTVIINYYRE